MGTRAHTVPKFFLRGFAAPESERARSPFVWIGSIKTGEIVRRSPKNISIVRGFYDGPGGFAQSDKSIEAHLAAIESEAAAAIARLLRSDPTDEAGIPAEIWRFLAWQAARTPGWASLVQQWANEPVDGAVMEAPPAGFDKIANRTRLLWVEHPTNGERREINDQAEFERLRSLGWKWILGRDDFLEALHIQAWYFRIRHFPRLSWVRLTAPKGETFVTSDRGVSWLVDGYADTPPAALRHAAAEVIAPLTRKTALVGRHRTSPLYVTPREINLFVAFSSSDWIAGSSRAVVELALADRRDHCH